MYKDQDGREVEVVEVDLEVNEGCYVVEAIYTDSGITVDDATCQYLTEKYQEQLYQEAYENYASNAYDRYKNMQKYGDS